MPEPLKPHYSHKSADANAVLVLGDGSLFWGKGIGAEGETLGEVCFTTAMTGYQETLTDPSFAGQIITFTFPHIGNTGANEEDIETRKHAARGLVIRENITAPSSWRSLLPFNDWLKKNKLTGICGVDTRALTHRIRDGGAPSGMIAFKQDMNFDLEALLEKVRAWPGLSGMDLVPEVVCEKSYAWNGSLWVCGTGYGTQANARFHVVAIDYGAKHNILRCLTQQGCRVTVVPGSASYEDIMAFKPDGIFLSNGPGDPAATGAYAVPVIRKLVDTGLPIFGICLGHQMLALALGAKTKKMHLGHRGANHPIKDLLTNKVEITSHNHGFCVVTETLPANAEATHISLFDGCNEGLRLKNKPVFSVQYHPEASPGPQDSFGLFKQFVDLIEKHSAEQKAA
jgi:carbamoyl-phosphate synthase small subunit